jgi:hypothetical protein
MCEAERKPSKVGYKCNGDGEKGNNHAVDDAAVSSKNKVR